MINLATKQRIILLSQGGTSGRGIVRQHLHSRNSSAPKSFLSLLVEKGPSITDELLEEPLAE